MLIIHQMTVGSGSLEHCRGDRPYWQDHGQDSQEPHSKVVVVVIVVLVVFVAA